MGAVSAQDVADSSDIVLADSEFSQINIDVSYEYANDNGKITPTFNVVNNTVVSQDYDNTNKYYNVKINSTDTSEKLNISISAPGYITQYKLVDANDASPIEINMMATDAYKLGYDVTAKADSLLDFKNADEVLVITTAGVPKLNGKTSELAIDGILNYATEYVSYGRGNILMLRQTALDPIDFCYVVKKGSTLTAAIFVNGNVEEVYLGTISENMTPAQWNNLYKAVGGEDAFSFASLANGWCAGVTYDVLQEAAFHGHICEGTLGGYTITKALLQYYPPIKETGNGLQSPGDITSYKVLSIPGDSASDAVIFFLDATAGKSGYTGFNTTSTGANATMIGFIRWNDKTSSGTIIVMDYNSAENKKLFQKETGITGEGSLEELKYNTWWINKIYTNPASLVKILIEKEGLNQEQYNYLFGTETDEVDEEGNVIYDATNSHGLDYAYIQSLDLPNATRDNAIANKGSLTYDDFKVIGQQAASIAKAIYEEELGIQIHKDMPNLMVLTSAGYVLINEQSTEACWDGLFEELGSRLSRKTLLPHHKPIWTPLFFNFALKQDDGSLMSIYMRYNENGSFYVGNFNGSQTYNFNISVLNSSVSGKINKQVYIDGNYFGIQSISNAWNGEPAFDQLITFLYHNHACPGVQPGFFIADYIQQNFPLNENQSYIYIANEQYCKEDSIEYMLDLSPGLGNYLVQKLTSDEYKGQNDLDEEGILIIWDSANNIGQAVTISYQWPSPDLSAYATSESKKAAQIQAFLDLYNGRDNPILTENYHTIAHGDSRWITQEQLNTITSGGEDGSSSLSYLRSLDDISKEDLLKQIADSQKDSESNNTNTNANTESNTTNSNSNSNANPSVPSSSNAQRGSSSVGTSSTPISASSEDAYESPSDDESSGKAYELDKPVSKSGSFNAVYAVIGALVIGALFGVGYMRTRKE